MGYRRWRKDHHHGDSEQVEQMCHPLHSTWVRIHAPWYGRDTTTMDSLRSHRTKSALSQTLRHPRQKDVGQSIKLRCGPFLETALGHIIHLQTPEKDTWTIFDLMEQQDILADSQLLTVEVKPSDYSCHFLFVGPPKPNTLFILKEGIHFHSIKDLITFFENYCHFHCCC